MHGLNSARGFLQKKIADRIQTRYTPVLTFINDQGVKKSIAASQLIREALAADAAQPETAEESESGLEASAGEPPDDSPRIRSDPRDPP